MPDIVQPTLPLGTAAEITIVGDEDGFELHILTTTDIRYVINIQACAVGFMHEVESTIGEWWNEGLTARASRPVTDDPDAYDVNDPKHPGWSVGV